MDKADWFFVYAGIGLITTVCFVAKHGWPEEFWSKGSTFYMWSYWPLVWALVILAEIKERRNSRSKEGA